MLNFTDMKVVGFIPQFLDESDPRPAVEQIHAAYSHGGGWHDFWGFNLTGSSKIGYYLSYPGDPPIQELSRANLRDEKLVFFECSWFAVIQANGSYRVARLD